MSKILIIEDDISITEIERDYLELNGFSVESAQDGTSGLARGLSGGFDLILLDLMLPGVDGFTVCRKLREKLDIPILMVTARQEDIDKIRGLGLGADDYIEKPFSPGVLVARVKAHLARYARLTQPSAAPAEITLGGVAVYENIWGMESMDDNSTVAVHINRLREKIEEDPGKPRYIQTVWGAGYRFKGQ